MSARPPRVSVLVITMNELAHLKKVVRNLSRQSIPVEIVVCDNASHDGTREWVESQGLPYFRSPKNVGTPVFNGGLALAKGKYVFIGATDMEFDSSCMERLAGYLDKNPSCGMAVPLNVNGNDRSKVDIGGVWLSRGFYGGAVLARPAGPVRMSFSGVGLLRRRAVEAAGGFIYEPTYFLYAEDVDLGFRLLRAGYHVQMVPRAVLYHYGYQSRRLFSKYFLTSCIERNMLTTMCCHLKKRHLLISVPYAILLRLLVFLKDAAKLDWQRAAARLNGIAWLAYGLPRIVGRRIALSQTLKSDSPAKYFGGDFYDEGNVGRIFLKYL